MTTSNEILQEIERVFYLQANIDLHTVERLTLDTEDKVSGRSLSELLQLASFVNECRVAQGLPKAPPLVALYMARHYAEHQLFHEEVTIDYVATNRLNFCTVDAFLETKPHLKVLYTEGAVTLDTLLFYLDELYTVVWYSEDKQTFIHYGDIEGVHQWLTY